MKKEINHEFQEKGFAVVTFDSFKSLLSQCREIEEPAWVKFTAFWDDLITDEYLMAVGNKIGRKFGTRKRRFIFYSYDMGKDLLTYNTTCQSFAQDRHYSNDTGDVANVTDVRKFELLRTEARENILLKEMIKCNLRIMACGADQMEKHWHGFVHFIRIYADGTGGIGTPSPEGIHRDNTYLLSMQLINKVGVQGGESRIYDPNHNLLSCVTLHDPYDAIFVDDEKVLHDVEPIISEAGAAGYRDMLIIDYRKGAGCCDDLK